VRGRPLLEVTTALAGPGLPSSAGPVRWEPVDIVAPSSPDLAAWIAAGEPQAAASEAEWARRLATG
jgi:hypothetical protein